MDSVLPDIWSSGQISAFSGIHGDTDWEHPFVAHTLASPPGLRFWPPAERTLQIVGPGAETAILEAELAASDALCARLGNPDGEPLRLSWAFKDHDTLVGEVALPLQPVVTAPAGVNCQTGHDYQTHSHEKAHTALCWKKGDESTRFAFAHSHRDLAAALERARAGLETDVDALISKRREYLESIHCPEAAEQKFKRLFYKCASVAAVNVHSSQGVIGVNWSTPDRVPHRNMWLWDSCFHSFGYRLMDMTLARDIVWAVLSTQREDGFIAHMMGPDGSLSEVTQPPLLAWAVWELHKAEPDLDFLDGCFPPLRDYLTWNIAHRDANSNDLLEWKISGDELCRSGESGADNSVRFDSAKPMDTVDFNVYIINDLNCLAQIAHELQRPDEEAHAREDARRITDALNQRLYNDSDGLYYDRCFDGEWVRVPSVASLLPLFAGCEDRRRADSLIAHLSDRGEFWTPLPVPTIARNHALYEPDMWRGPVWLNMNFLIYLGLKRWDRLEQARELAVRTITEVARWYEQTGCVWEFYDADAECLPLELDRKKVLSRSSGTKTISDYNWTACLTMAFINELYGEQKQRKGILQLGRDPHQPRTAEKLLDKLKPQRQKKREEED